MCHGCCSASCSCCHQTRAPRLANSNDLTIARCHWKPHPPSSGTKTSSSCWTGRANLESVLTESKGDHWWHHHGRSAADQHGTENEGTAKAAIPGMCVCLCICIIVYLRMVYMYVCQNISYNIICIVCTHTCLWYGSTILNGSCIVQSLIMCIYVHAHTLIGEDWPFEAGVTPSVPPEGHLYHHKVNWRSTKWAQFLIQLHNCVLYSYTCYACVYRW